MRHTLIFFTFSLLFLTSPLFGQSDEKCYVVVDSSEDIAYNIIVCETSVFVLLLEII